MVAFKNLLRVHLTGKKMENLQGEREKKYKLRRIQNVQKQVELLSHLGIHILYCSGNLRLCFVSLDRCLTKLGSLNESPKITQRAAPLCIRLSNHLNEDRHTCTGRYITFSNEAFKLRQNTEHPRCHQEEPR